MTRMSAEINATTVAAPLHEAAATQAPSSPSSPSPPSSPSSPPLKILFLSSDTGGGHRASANALGGQFQRLYPGSTYSLLDITSSDFARPPYNNLQSWYSHLSSNPKQWNIVYKVSNNKMLEPVFKFHFKMSTVEHKIRRCIKEYEADVVISVHPLMNDVPLLSCMKISNETNRHLPFFTVVTDLGSGHCAWFEKDVEKMFIASGAIEKLARERGNVPVDKIVMSGLPIRHEFAFESERLGDRTSMEGKIYQLQMRGYLRLFDDNLIDEREDRKVLLVMGGGEGVGSLESIVHRLYLECSLNNIRAIILVVCGRNEVLKRSLENYDWDSALEEEIALARDSDEAQLAQVQPQENCELSENKHSHSDRQDRDEVDQKKINSKGKGHQGIASKVTGIILNPLRVLSLTKRGKEKEGHKIESTAMVEEKKELQGGVGSSSSTASSSSSSSSSTMAQNPPQVIVKPLGFISNMAEYMVAADILITKAGPGTIAEAASLGLPVLLTSFLPGQEEGNVDFVLQKKFGQYQSVSNPNKIASTACEWLRNPDKMVEMSLHARRAGMPNAAEDIVKCIGKSVLRWKEVQEEQYYTLNK